MLPGAEAVRGRAVASRPGRRVIAILAIVLGGALVVSGAGHADGHGAVHVVEISGEIDLGLAPFLDRSLREAATDGAAAVLLEIDTPGGRLDAVLQMRDTLLDSPVRTVAYIDRTALSAGALIALSADEIHVAPGAVFGAATPVDGTGIEAGEKVISAVRSVFRSTAQQQGRDPVVAEAMVDTDVAIDGLVARGALLTLTADEALRVGFADGQATNRSALLDTLGLGDRELVETSISPAERLARLVSNPLVSALLLAGGVLLLIGDLLSGGIGAGAAAGTVLLGTFLGGHLVAGLAGWEDVVLVAVGVALLLLEVFVIPGFGVAGGLGLAAILGGGSLAMLDRDFDFVGTEQLVRVGLTVGAAFVLIAGGLLVLMTALTRTGGPRSLVLGASLGDGVPVTQRSSRGWLGWFDAEAVLDSDRGDLVGQDGDVPTHLARPEARPGTRGVALTDLRPAGVAEFGGRRVDVVTDGEYLHAGDPVEVLVDEGYRRVVRRSRS